MSTTVVKPDKEFTKKICEESGVDVSACYQCMKCSAGCPVSEIADSTPAHILRKVLLGMKDELMQGDFMWLCVGCETCKTRCPQDISTRAVVDALKKMAYDENVEPKEKNVALLYQHFLNIVRARGRINEPLLMMYYKLGSKDYMGDMDLGMEMIKKGKMGVNPLTGKIKGNSQVREIIGEK